MAGYIGRRLLLAILVLIIVTVIIFMGMRLLPGDPILMYLTANNVESISNEEVELLRHEYGVDRPLAVQYFSWAAGVFRGDLGQSIAYNSSVTGEVLRRIPITLHLGLLAFLLGWLIGVPAGIICAIRRGGWLDTVITFLTNIGITIPSFWLGILMIYLFSLYFNWLPTYGYTSPFEDFWGSTKQLVMPVICLALFPVASMARQTRSSMLEVLRQDYIRTAWSKGLKERQIVILHALKNGLIPIVTYSGLGLSSILGGAVIIEQVFAIPGIGRLSVTSLFNHDYAVTQGVTLVIASGVVFINLLVDVSFAWLDPRIRLG
jgi:peptide/nickel transport system permease protein